MRLPAAKEVDLRRGVYPQEVLDAVDTGYVRLTVEDNGLHDHFVFFENREIIGAFSEFADGRKLYSRQALDHILSLNQEALAEIATYREETLERIRKDHPETFLAPGTTEKFKIGTSLFTGVLSGVKSGDLLDVLLQLERQSLVGCLRVTREVEDFVQEGAILFKETPVAAVLESADSVRLGDEALREIALFFTEGKAYKQGRKFVDDYLFFNNASRLKSPVEETISSEKASEDLKRFMALKMMGLERGTLVLNAPCNGTFSFEALLRSAASRNFDGYLWVRSDDARGLMVLGKGKIQAALIMDPSGELMGREALRKIYDDMESSGIVDFYQLSSSPHVSQPFEEEETDDVLVRRLLGEMGQDLMKEVSLAKEFKKRWKSRRKDQGE
ncbi:MAG: DUF2226 domain-containing protein [Theionarchaea archaeon]|nr:DUF2226 domain-containing protein [Theionarchaea archaeon]MBU7037118.1 DUF2226 domain-containing protein [Theionarchaea archaeon]